MIPLIKSFTKVPNSNKFTCFVVHFLIIAKCFLQNVTRLKKKTSSVAVKIRFVHGRQIKH